ncbi:MAG TPA: hypothetical protein VIR27_13895 [Mycobacteriales bacterium]|jgi:hypothetical protein
MPGLFRSRRERPPRAALAGLPADDRVLTWATLDDGQLMLATRYGLWLPDRDERLLPWYRIVRATWRDGVLGLVEAVEHDPGVMVESPPRRYRLVEPRRLPHTVRQRIENSIGYTARHHLDPTGSVYVVGRRVAGQDGLTWYLVFDADANPDDPLVRARAEELLGQARAATNL